MHYENHAFVLAFCYQIRFSDGVCLRVATHDKEIANNKHCPTVVSGKKKLDWKLLVKIHCYYSKNWCRGLRKKSSSRVNTWSVIHKTGLVKRREVWHNCDIHRNPLLQPLAYAPIPPVPMRCLKNWVH